MRILVTGASGFVGSLLVPRLLADGHAVRALGRDPVRVSAALMGPLADAARDIDEVEVLSGDAISGRGLAAAVAGVDVAYYLIHSMEPVRPFGNSGETRPSCGTRDLRSSGDSRHSGGVGGSTSFDARERLAAHNFAEACARAGVGRIVYLGGLVPRDRAASRHLASRETVERILLDAVPDSLALRASIVIGARSRSFRFLVRLVERLPVLTLPAWRSFHTQPIDERDVIAMLAAAATARIATSTDTSSMPGRSLDIGGPDVLSYEELISRIADHLLVRRPVFGFGVNLTPLTGRVAAAIAAEDPELILPLMEGLHGDLLPRDSHAAELLDVPLHSFDSAVEHALRAWEELEPLAAR